MKALLPLLLLSSAAAFSAAHQPSPKKAKSRPALLARAAAPAMSMAPIPGSAAVIGAANVLGFGISVATGWHYHLDLIGTGCFAISAVAVMGGAPVQRLSAGAVSVWASKLAGFLFFRALQTKRDARLEDILSTVSGAAGFWFISLAWGWFVSLPHTLAAGVPAFAASKIGPVSLAGFAMYVVGLVLETVADLQKWRFKQDPATRAAFCDVGVWRLCQHPNWLGNLLLWSGIFLLNAPTLFAKQELRPLRRWLRLGAAALSPLFMLGLFSGQANGAIGNAVELAAKRYGGDAKYQAYLAATPLLFPTLKSLKAAFGRG